MSEPAPLAAEHYRILRAAGLGVLRYKDGRWRIQAGYERAPDFKSRRRLIALGLIDHPRYDPPPADNPWLRIDSHRLFLTDKGRAALAAKPSTAPATGRHGGAQ